MNTIYVEDKNKDRLFIETYLKYLGLQDHAKVISTGGYTALFSEAFLNRLNDTKKAGGKNIVIFDADTVSNEGGFEKRKVYLSEKAKENNIELNIFLFPDNQKDGDFENLLEQIVPEQHKGLLECFESYENCVAKRQNSLYKVPDRKNKLHTYIYTFKKPKEDEKRIGSNDYCFENYEYWNLDSDTLAPLGSFLMTILDQQ